MVNGTFYIYLDFRRNGMTNLARRWQRFSARAGIMSVWRDIFNFSEIIQGSSAQTTIHVRETRNVFSCAGLKLQFAIIRCARERAYLCMRVDIADRVPMLHGCIADFYLDARY